MIHGEGGKYMRVCLKLKMELYFDMSGLTPFEVQWVKSCLDCFIPYYTKLDYKCIAHPFRNLPTKLFGALQN